MVDLATKVSDISKLINTSVLTNADRQNLNQNQGQQEAIIHQAINFDVQQSQIRQLLAIYYQNWTNKNVRVAIVLVFL